MEGRAIGTGASDASVHEAAKSGVRICLWQRNDLIVTIPIASLPLVAPVGQMPSGPKSHLTGAQRRRIDLSIGRETDSGRRCSAAWPPAPALTPHPGVPAAGFDRRRIGRCGVLEEGEVERAHSCASPTPAL
jgi:hypothetical protein